MGNHTTRHLSSHRKHVIHSWNTIYNHDPTIINKTISEAWLKAAELTPTWVWALVNLPETMHSTYHENAKFVNMIQQVRDFFQLLIKVHKCDPEMIKTLSFRLGARHRHYMNEGNDNSYWAPFAQQLPLAMTKTYLHIVNNDNRIRRILRIRSRNEKSEEEQLIESWREFMNMVVESMKRGYEGCESQKTPLRLSITNSIISMASMRSTRSRSTSHFLDPNMSPAMGVGGIPIPGVLCPSTALSTSPTSISSSHCRSRSIFRSRPQRSSQDLSTLRRLSSPNHGSVILNNTDLQLLKLTDCRNVKDQRRSLSLLPIG